MADPVPAANAALLAAQAKAGQAGVDAYKAAQASLQQQRQQAVQQAMREAALRGAPAGAIGSIQSTITNPYDQGIQRMAEQSAGYQADMAARDRRMADYNSAVQAARSFIPEQVQLAVAPIKAQGEYAVRQEQMRGEQSVAEILANTELTKARMAATALAARIKAAKDAAGKALNQSQIQGLLGQRVSDLLGVTGDIGTAITENQKRAQADVNKLVGAGVLETTREQQLNQGRNLAGAGTAALMLPTAAAHSVAQGVTAATNPDIIRGQQLAGQGTAALMAPFALPGMAAGQTGLPGGGYGENPSETQRRTQEAADLSRKQALNMALLSSFGAVRGLNQRATAAPGGIPQWYKALLGAVAEAPHITTTGNGQNVFLTQQQIKDLPQFGQDIVQAGMQQPGGIWSAQDWATMLGDPSRDIQAQLHNRPNDAGVASPFASQVTRAAYQQAAQELVDSGANVDAATLAASMPRKYQSAFDYMAEQSGTPDAQQTYSRGVAQGTALQKGQTQAQKTKDDAIVRQLFGKTLPSSFGSSTDIIDRLQDPQTSDALDQATNTLRDIVKSFTSKKQKPSHQELLSALDDAYTSKQQSIDPWIAQLALLKLGF